MMKISIYDSVEKYSKKLNMSVEQAKVRLDYFSKVKVEIEESRKCPKCGQYTLVFEGGEWECGISDYIYCENDKIEKVDEEGDLFYDECDFNDDVKSEYLFAFNNDFDVVLMMSCGLDINDNQDVLNAVGLSWDEFVKKDTENLSKG